MIKGPGLVPLDFKSSLSLNIPLVTQGYEERRYPSVNFACTELTYEMPEDNDEGEWTLEKVMEWMSSSKSRKDRPQSKMFLKLFRYIAGVNSEAQEIEMTIPVISKLAPSEVSPFLDGIHVRNHEFGPQNSNFRFF